MTNEDFIKCMEQNEPVYKIWIDSSKFKQKRCRYQDFLESDILRGWINNDVMPYAQEGRCMYCTDSHMESCKKKMLLEFKTELQNDISIAQKKLSALNNIRL